MKKTLIILSCLLVLTGVLFGCGDKGDGETTTTKPTTVIGQAVTSYVNKEGNMIYETDDKNTVSVDYLDENGKLKYTEKYIYDEYGESIGFSYLDKNGTLIAKYKFAGENIGYFNEGDYPISEEEFSKRMEKLLTK